MWKLLEFICRHVVLSLELNIFLPVAHVMNTGISYLFIKVLTPLIIMSHKRCCMYTRFVDNYPQTQICFSFTRNRELLCYGLQNIYFILTHNPFCGLVHWTMNRMLLAYNQWKFLKRRKLLVKMIVLSILINW